MSTDRREILDAVESWLVDPRPRPRMQHESRRTPWDASAEIDLDSGVLGSLSIDRPA